MRRSRARDRGDVSMRWLANAAAYSLFVLGIARALLPVQTCIAYVGRFQAITQGTLYWPWQQCPPTNFQASTPRPDPSTTAVQAAVLLGAAVWLSWQRRMPGSGIDALRASSMPVVRPEWVRVIVSVAMVVLVVAVAVAAVLFGVWLGKGH